MELGRPLPGLRRPIRARLSMTACNHRSHALPSLAKILWYSLTRWSSMVAATRCQTHRKRGLHRTRLIRHDQNVRSTHLQHGLCPARSRHPSLIISSNECKRCKVKCIRLEDNIDCQRCSTMNVACVIVPTATQNAKEKEKSREKSHVDE